jgi:hypothetical protein
MMDLTAGVAGCKVFSKIDLWKGYLQIPMHAADIQKITIINSFRLFKVLHLPFGLRNAGNTFQQKMDRVTRELNNAFDYLDYLIIYSKTLEDSAKHLFQILSHLQGHGLVIKIEKCVCVGDTHIGAVSSDETDLHIKSSTGPPTSRDPHPSSLPLEVHSNTTSSILRTV